MRRNNLCKRIGDDSLQRNKKKIVNKISRFEAAFLKKFEDLSSMLEFSEF